VLDDETPDGISGTLAKAHRRNQGCSSSLRQNNHLLTSALN